MGLLLMLNACAHYYPSQAGYYRAGAGYSAGYGVSRSNYYQYSPHRNYYYNNTSIGNYSSEHQAHSHFRHPQNYQERHHSEHRFSENHQHGVSHQAHHQDHSWQNRADRRFEYSTHSPQTHASTHHHDGDQRPRGSDRARQNAYHTGERKHHE